ncbi:LexA family protein [Brucella haematophila]|uniref:LexA family protein n=1 Tax=Brucella haematophila TaxID=419474 RepID=UPI00110E240F|nr:translesion error-prone DNA polymerase V autoproteolytic subunit [Brucella haematophila]TMU86425.1 translesion error-prone DNA polymerase V autoproteolytic subunit [Brucella haematophila]
MQIGLKVEAEVLVPLILHGLCAGFPSPADDYIDDTIDLSKLLISNPPATFLWRVDGHSMRDAGIFHGDLLIVDRSVKPRDGDIVVATVHGERSLKRLNLKGVRPRLTFENRDMPTFEIPELAEVEVWGVAISNIHWLRPRK